MEQSIEKWTGKVNEVTIGATKEEGGTRSRKVAIGGATTLPFLKFEGEIPHPPVLAMEVWDTEPEEWPEILKEPFRDVLNNPVQWAIKCEKEYNPDLICLRLASTNPDIKDTTGEEAANTVKKVLAATTLPLIIIGSGQAVKDTEIALPVCEAAKGERCLLGIAVQENYKTMTAACMSCGHAIIAESPIDINLAKQLNILISDMGFPGENVVMHHATGALGYGLEYTYSIMERSRLAALQGDKMMSPPMMNFIAQEVWRTKEAKTSEADISEWGPLYKRGPLWEFVTGMAFLQAGADLLVLAHPLTLENTRKVINNLMGQQ